VASSTEAARGAAVQAGLRDLRRACCRGPDVSASTEDPRNPVVLEGSASIVTKILALQRFLGLMNAK
jgi:hypothetical protein